MFSAEIWELVQCKQLVYSAPGLSGGVGLTAVQYALRLGAVVYATAGNQVSSIFRFDPQSVTRGAPVIDRTSRTIFCRWV